MLTTKKTETAYSIENLARDLEAIMVKGRAAKINGYALEAAIERALQTQRSYIASSLRF
jgi:hypothetical protein